jgi:hypothetical protein
MALSILLKIILNFHNLPHRNTHESSAEYKIIHMAKLLHVKVE